MTLPRRPSTRGHHRREHLVTAAASLLVERGITGLTYRAVALRAEMPLATATYHFATIEDLTQEALVRVTQTWQEAARGLVAQLPERLDRAQVAKAVLEIATARPAEVAVTHVGGVVALYERYLEAGRHLRLRPVVHDYNEALLGLVQTVLGRGGLPADRDTAQLALAAVDGAAIYAIAEGQSPAVPALRVLGCLLAVLPVSVPVPDRGAG
ncbi:MAG: TetR family transcriptional regulator [Frankiales bacterium]|nr:TetR family transcriptional regulator [Frankiales bacterium]